MPTHTSVGRSVAPHAFRAGQEAAREAVEPLNGTPHLALVFGTTGYDQDELLAGVRAEVGGARVVGCSGEGVIAGAESYERERAVGVMAIRSDLIYFDVFLLPDYSADPAARGRELGSRIAPLDDAIGVWLLADGLRGDCTSFLGGLQDTLGRPLPVVGGTAADAFRFVQTYQYLDDVATSDAVCAIVLRGHGRVEVAVSHGCLPVGRSRVVTRAENGWVYEIDGRPAWSVFREYLDGDPQDLNAEGIVQLCLGEKLESKHAAAYAPYVIRTPLQLDQETLPAMSRSSRLMTPFRSADSVLVSVPVVGRAPSTPGFLRPSSTSSDMLTLYSTGRFGTLADFTDRTWGGPRGGAGRGTSVNASFSAKLWVDVDACAAPD